MDEIIIETRQVPDEVADKGKNEDKTEGKGKNEAKAEDGKNKVGGKKRVTEVKVKPEAVSAAEQTLSKALPPTVQAAPPRSTKLSENLFTNSFGLLEDEEGNVYIFSTKRPMDEFDQNYYHCINYTHISLVRTTKNTDNHYINYAGKSAFKFITIPVFITGFNNSYGAAVYVTYKGPENDEAKNRHVRYAVFVEAMKRTLLTKYQRCTTKSHDTINYIKFVGDSVPIDGCMGTMVWDDKSDRTVSGVKFTPAEFQRLQTINIGKKIIIAVDPNPESTLIHAVGSRPEPVKKVNTKLMTATEKKRFKKEKKDERRERRIKNNNSIEGCIENAEDSNSDDDIDEDGDEEEQREEERPDQEAPLFFQGSSAQPNGVMTEKVNSAAFFEHLKNRSTSSSTYPAMLCKMIMTSKMMNHQAIKKVDPPSGGVASMGLPIEEDEEDTENVGFTASALSSASAAGGYKLALGSRCTSIVVLRQANQNELESSDNSIIEDVFNNNLEKILCESDVSEVNRSCRKRKRE